MILRGGSCSGSCRCPGARRWMQRPSMLCSHLPRRGSRRPGNGVLGGLAAQSHLFDVAGGGCLAVRARPVDAAGPWADWPGATQSDRGGIPARRSAHDPRPQAVLTTRGIRRFRRSPCSRSGGPCMPALAERSRPSGRASEYGPCSPRGHSTDDVQVGPSSSSTGASPPAEGSPC
jgi:hypothetical protein